MTNVKALLGSAALAALISGSGAGLATAQTDSQSNQTQTETQNGTQTEAQTETQTAPSGNQSPAASGDDGSQSGDQQAGSAEQSDEDRLVAKVNDVEIRQSDVVNAIENLPPRVQQMPRQMLMPIVVEQLLTRELILEQGQSEDLQSDPAVVSIIEEQTQALEDQAIVNVWVERELGERITEERIQAAFDRFKSANPDSTVTLDEARPQLQQALRQEVMQELSAELREGAEIVLYDASGNPVPENQAGSASGEPQQTGQDAGDAGSPDQSSSQGQQDDTDSTSETPSQSD